MSFSSFVDKLKVLLVSLKDNLNEKGFSLSEKKIEEIM
jgi:hypothetical protein